MDEEFVEGVFAKLLDGRRCVPSPAEEGARVKFTEPQEPGMCVVFAKKLDCFPGIVLRPNGLVYIGRTDKLRQRLGNHFNAEHSGSSTLRRSIGAIFREEWKLTPIPRQPRESDKNGNARFTDFRFKKENEACLRDWMRSNLKYATYQYGGDLGELKRDLILGYCPPLNLDIGGSPYIGEIKRLRRECRDEAKNRP